MKDRLRGHVSTVFSTQLGWFSISWQGEKVCQLSFGHASRQAATERTRNRVTPTGQLSAAQQQLMMRLKDFAQGGDEDFQDVQIVLDKATRFQHEVYQQCRRIPRGETASYQTLACRAGSPRAARAVGNAMAHNPIPLIVPCHRVVAAERQGLGGFSAPGGLAMKRRLLALESGAD